MTRRRRLNRYGSLLVSCVLLMAACSSSSDDAADSSASANDSVVANDDTSSGQSGSADDPSSADDSEAPTVTEDADHNDACPSVAAVDLWPDLESAVPADIAGLVRDRTSGLTQPNPETCTSMVPADLVVEPAEVGAAAAASVEHVDPYVRYDIYVYESGEAADAATARDVLRFQLPEFLPAGSDVQVSRVGQTLFVARSFVDDGSGASREILALQDYYSALIAGTE